MRCNPSRCNSANVCALRSCGSLEADLRLQRLLAELSSVPEDRTVEIDRQIDNFRLDRPRCCSRVVDADRVRTTRNGDDEYDEQYQHDVDQRRHVDLGICLAI